MGIYMGLSWYHQFHLPNASFYLLPLVLLLLLGGGSAEAGALAGFFFTCFSFVTAERELPAPPPFMASPAVTRPRIDRVCVPAFGGGGGGGRGGWVMLPLGVDARSPV